MRRRLVAGSVVALAAASAFAVTRRDELAAAARSALVLEPSLLVLALAALLLALVAAAGAWRAALDEPARLGAADAAGRYGCGSLVNALAPVRLGDAVRLELFARALSGRNRRVRVCAAVTVAGTVRSIAVGVFAVAAILGGALPAWALVPGAVAAAGIALAVVARRRLPTGLALDSRRLARVTAWVAASCVLRVAALTALARAAGADDAVAVALAVACAIELAGIVPLTPGNLGLGTGAVAFVLHENGVVPTSRSRRLLTRPRRASPRGVLPPSRSWSRLRRRLVSWEAAGTARRPHPAGPGFVAPAA